MPAVRPEKVGRGSPGKLREKHEVIVPHPCSVSSRTSKAQGSLSVPRGRGDPTRRGRSLGPVPAAPSPLPPALSRTSEPSPPDLIKAAGLQELIRLNRGTKHCPWQASGMDG